MNWRVQTLFFTVLLLVVLLIEVLFLPPLTQDLPYSQFKALVRAGQVANLTISATTIEGTLLTPAVTPEPSPPAPAQPPHRFTTTRVEDPELIKELEAHSIAFSGQADRTGWVLSVLSWLAPLFLLVVFWSAYLRRMGGGVGSGLMAVGKSRAKVYVEHEIKTRFDEVAGVEEAKEELQEVIEFLRTPEKFRRLGGRVAEEITFGDVSTGAQDDLQKATDIARSMVTEYGMSERLGVRTFEKERRGLFLDTPWATKKDYSEAKAAAIDNEVEEIIERAHHRVQALLTTRKPVLEHLARLLLAKEVLEGDELRRIIGTAASTNGECHGKEIGARLEADRGERHQCGTPP